MTSSERLEWLKARQTGIGGSDVAAILGLSKRRTPLDIYNSKIADDPIEESNPSIEWGNRLEPVIRQKYADETGLPVTIPNKTFRHPDYPFMIANVDGLLPDGAVLEIKTARSGTDWGEEGTDEIPEYYLTQVQHYMTVVGAKMCDVAVLIGASDFRIYHVDFDPEIAAMLIEEEKAFWQRVIDRNPPAPRTYAEASIAFPRSKANSVEATDEILNDAAELESVNRQIEELKARKEELQGTITSFMGESDTLALCGKTIATWKTSKPRVTFDSAAFKAKHPDLYAQYLKEGVASRRFLLKIKSE